MHILPPLETVKDIAATQQYDVLPLSCEILSDFITPIEAMRILKNVSTHCYMLESAQADDRWGRYTFLGLDPKLEITCIDGKMKAGGLTVRTDDPSQYLRELLSSYRSPRFDYLPSFTGGLVGYFSYDYLKYSEPSVRCGEQDEDSFKDVDLMLFDKVIAFDHVRQKIVLIVNMVLSDVEVGYNKAKLELERLVSLLKTGEKKQEAPGRLLGEVTPLFSKEQFCAMVETAKQHILEGDIFQIVLHGMKSYFCQDEYGQIAPVYSISAGLDYPGVGPEHAYLHDIGRAEYVAITDEEAVQAFEYLARTEGIIPAIESAHAVAYSHPRWGAISFLSSRSPAAATRTAPPSPATEGRIFMSDLARAFDHGKAFIAFLTCGDPDLETTAAAVRAAAQNSADLIELGIPFSDPTAEGLVIQAANLRALQSGVTTDKIFDLVRELRRGVTIPMVFMTYANVVFSYGTERFLSNYRDVGIDGLILPDVPYEEKEEFLPACRKYGVDFVSLIAPTSENRIAMIAREAEGFLYIVSSLGVTGERSEIKTDLASIVSLVRENTDIPCAIGFGISTPEQAKKMADLSDGAIVGSAIVKLLAQYGKDAPEHIGAYVKEMKDALR